MERGTEGIAASWKTTVGAADERRDLFVVADIGALEIDPRAHLLQVALVAGQQVVDHDDSARAFGKQSAHDGGADEARPLR